MLSYCAFKNVAENEGKSVGDYKDKTLEQCKELCNKNRLCKSFSFGKSGCYLKNKCIKTNDAQKPNSGYQTYYTKCNGNIIYVLIQFFTF